MRAVSYTPGRVLWILTVRTYLLARPHVGPEKHNAVMWTRANMGHESCSCLRRVVVLVRACVLSEVEILSHESCVTSVGPDVLRF